MLMLVLLFWGTNTPIIPMLDKTAVDTNFEVISVISDCNFGPNLCDIK